MLEYLKRVPEENALAYKDGDEERSMEEEGEKLGKV